MITTKAPRHQEKKKSALSAVLGDFSVSAARIREAKSHLVSWW
jgi:hypothetical protein